MEKTVIHELAKYGQSIWLDNINRKMLETGKLKEMINLGLRGMTSNPTIFDKSISKSQDYDNMIVELCRKGKSTFEIYDDLTVRDVQDAALLFMPVFLETKGLDGYVSLEVNPELAFNHKETIEEAKRLYKKVNRPNVMFKIPSTKEGFIAVEELISCGINVNVTLIFSLEQYINTANAYIAGLHKLNKNGGDLSNVRSVASIFVSRVDTVIDRILDEKPELSSLKGKAAVANSSLIYKEYIDIFSSEDYKKLQSKGANLQRVLWASTSTKNPNYNDVKYVTELIAKDAVNTLPEKTFDAYLDHGGVKEGLCGNAESAKKTISDLRDCGIDINHVCDELLKKGVTSFSDSFKSLLNAIKEKAKAIYKK